MICIIDCQSIIFLPHFSMKEAILRILDPKVVWPLEGKSMRNNTFMKQTHGATMIFGQNTKLRTN